MAEHPANHTLGEKSRVRAWANGAVAGAATDMVELIESESRKVVFDPRSRRARAIDAEASRERRRSSQRHPEAFPAQKKLKVPLVLGGLDRDLVGERSGCAAEEQLVHARRVTTHRLDDFTVLSCSVTAVQLRPRDEVRPLALSIITPSKSNTTASRTTIQPTLEQRQRNLAEPLTNTFIETVPCHRHRDSTGDRGC